MPQKRIFFINYLSILFLITANFCLSAYKAHAEENKPRPYFEYQGNYRDQINELKAKFKNQFGYDLVDLDKSWTPQEIAIMQSTFSQLPESFLLEECGQEHRSPLKLN